MSSELEQDQHRKLYMLRKIATGEWFRNGPTHLQTLPDGSRGAVVKTVLGEARTKSSTFFVFRLEGYDEESYPADSWPLSPHAFRTYTIRELQIEFAECWSIFTHDEEDQLRSMQRRHYR